MLEIAPQKGRRGGTIHIVIAEDRDAFAPLAGIGKPGGRRIHIGEDGRVRHEVAQARLQKSRRLVLLDAARGKNARDDLGEPLLLGHRQRQCLAALVESRLPAPPAERALDAEKCPSMIRHEGVNKSRSGRTQAKEPSASPKTAR